MEENDSGCKKGGREGEGQGGRWRERTKVDKGNGGRHGRHIGVVGVGRVVVNRRWKGRGVGEEVALPGRQGKMERRANAEE